MAERITPYGAFNFLVNLDGPNGADTPLGGFSDVSGIGTELTIAEYRNGNDRENHVRKVAGIHKVSDVTLKRGIVNSGDLCRGDHPARRGGQCGRVLGPAGRAADEVHRPDPRRQGGR